MCVSSSLVYIFEQKVGPSPRAAVTGHVAWILPATPTWNYSAVRRGVRKQFDLYSYSQKFRGEQMRRGEAVNKKKTVARRTKVIRLARCSFRRHNVLQSSVRRKGAVHRVSLQRLSRRKSWRCNHVISKKEEGKSTLCAHRCTTKSTCAIVQGRNRRCTARATGLWHGTRRSPHSPTLTFW